MDNYILPRMVQRQSSVHDCNNTTNSRRIIMRHHYDDRHGIIMMIGTASKPTGGYYVMDKWDNNALSFRTATNGPILFTSSRHSWLPQAYADTKVMIQLSCVKAYQSAPRDAWNTAIQLGFADSRYTGPCFQGMSSHDVSSFVQSVNSSFLECERGCKSIISDSDLDSKPATIQNGDGPRRRTLNPPRQQKR